MNKIKKITDELGWDKEYMKSLAIGAAVGVALGLIVGQRGINRDVQRLSKLADQNLVVVTGAINQIAEHAGMDKRMTIA